jgi:glycosyltransferase involved in cell wall biosynthesis
MKITIITPVFNGESYIHSCLQNIIGQNYDDLEVIIVDGESTDKTIEILKDYSCKYPFIHWTSEKDHGQSDAMNKGISLATGEIIGFLNVDDYYEPGTLKRVQEIFKSLPEPSLVVGNCNVWGPDDTLLYINKPSKLTLFDIVSGSPFPVNPSAYFYHKSLHNHIGLFDIDDTYTMDLDFLLRAVEHANVVYFNEIWGNFRFIEGTKTYEDRKKDIAFGRMKKIFQKYRKNLQFSKRIHSRLNFFILESGRFCFDLLRSFKIDPKFLSDRINH